MATRLHIRDSTRERDETYLRSLILPHFGTRRRRDITRHDIQDWIAELAEGGYAAATIQLANGLVSMAFNAAVDDALIQRTPCSGVNLPRHIETEKRFLSVDELHRLADTIDPRHRTLVLTAGYTGARFGELAALQPRDLDLSRCRVTITRSLADVRGIIAETEPKTAASKRSITLPQAVVDDLATHLRQHAPGRTDRVFAAPQGAPLRRRSFRQRIWFPAVDASVGQPMRFHDLRHTLAALLIGATTTRSCCNRGSGTPRSRPPSTSRTPLRTPRRGRRGPPRTTHRQRDRAPSAHGTWIGAVGNRPRNSEQPLRGKGCIMVEVTGFEPVAPTLRMQRPYLSDRVICALTWGFVLNTSHRFA